MSMPKVQIALRTRKLGVLIRDARVAARKTGAEVSRTTGISPAFLRAYEEGRKAPSLPELEVLAYYLNQPIQHFWSAAAVSTEPAHTEPINIAQLLALRQRMIGAFLRQQRLQSSISIPALATDTGISQSRLKSFELGENAIPVPELEAILTVVGSSVEACFDQNSQIGACMRDQAAMLEFMKLSPEMRAFVCTPVNHPYLELARNLSQLSTERLRAVAEALLDITL